MSTTLSQSALYARRKRRLQAEGRYGERLVDPTRARQYIDDFRTRYGISYIAFGELAGISGQRIEQMMQPGHHLYPQRIHVDRERLILAARWDLYRLPDHHWISPVGVQRRMQALGWMGWTQRDISAMYGTAQGAAPFGRTRQQHHAAGVVKRMDAIYQRLCMTQGPSTRTAAIARRKGWAPPLAWDDDTIDDTTAVPAFAGDTFGAQDSEYWSRRLLRWIDAYRLGRTIEQIAAAEGITVGAVRQHCDRHGRTDLGRALWATMTHEPNATGRKKAS